MWRRIGLIATGAAVAQGINACVMKTWISHEMSRPHKIKNKKDIRSLVYNFNDKGLKYDEWFEKNVCSMYSLMQFCAPSSEPGAKQNRLDQDIDALSMLTTATLNNSLPYEAYSRTSDGRKIVLTVREDCKDLNKCDNDYDACVTGLAKN